MQIQLVIAEQDSRYLNNLLTYLERNHMDKLEIFSFSKPDMLAAFFTKHRADVVLLSDSFGISAAELTGCGKIAYLSQETGIAEKDGIRVIAKYKKPELIFKDILDLYAENGTHVAAHMRGNGNCSTIYVTGFSGGTGSSMVAAALAKKYARQGKKTLYLNLEKTGSSMDFFSAEGNYRFEDVIFGLKSQRTDMRLKLQSCVRMDKSGVAFFAPCSTAMYMLELTYEDIEKILDTLILSGYYERIVVDMEFQLSPKFMGILDRMDRIVLTSDGTETSNSKFRRTVEALHILEGQEKTNVTGKMSLIYNKFSSSKSSNEILELHMPVLGKIPPIKHALVNEIIGYVLDKQPEVFERLS